MGHVNCPCSKSSNASDLALFVLFFFLVYITAAMIEFEATPLCAMTPQDLYQALKLRSDVFVVEQACIYPELDNKDIHEKALHVLGRKPDKETNEDNIIAYARCLPPGLSYSGSSIGRVVVAHEFRGQGLAQVLMQQAMDVCRMHWPEHNIEIGAQLHLQPFYQSLGFESVGKPYDEDGIMHLDMIYRVNDS